MRPSPQDIHDASESPPRAEVQRQRFGKAGFKATIACVAALLALVAVDVAVRIFAPPDYEPRRFEPDGRVPFVVYPNGRFAYQPGVTFSSVYDRRGDERGYFDSQGRVMYRLNNLGLRGADIMLEKPEGVTRIVCLGDSFTFGEGVREEHTYPARLEAILSGRLSGERFQVINAGVQGYGTLEELYLYGLVCDPLRPDVVIIGFVLNDAADPGETIRLNDERTRAFEPSALGRVSALWEQFERGREAGRIDREYAASIRESFSSQRWQDTETAFAGMRAYADERGFRLAMVVFPLYVDLDGEYPFADLHALVAKACRDAGIAHLDLLDVFSGQPAQQFWVHPTDQHPNEIAHGMAAERLADFLLELGVINSARR